MVNLQGACLCGEVTYEYKGDVGSVINCHCLECRKWHGAAFRTRTTGKAENFFWKSGEISVGKYEGQPNVIKTFCKICGSNLVSFYKNDNTLVGLPIAGMEGTEHLKPECHIFVENKAAWHTITDGLPQYDAMIDLSVKFDDTE